VSEFGKLGLTAIGSSREEVDELYQRTLGVLDRETQYGRPEAPREASGL